MQAKGFTLVETVMCTIVLCLAGAVAYPQMKMWNTRQCLHSETLQLVSELRRARSFAVMKNQYVVFTYIDAGYKIFVDDGAGGGIKDDGMYQVGEQLLSEVFFPDGVKIISSESTFTANRAMFSGNVGVKAGTVVLTGGGGDKNMVIMNIVGRVRVEKV